MKKYIALLLTASIALMSASACQPQASPASTASGSSAQTQTTAAASAYTTAPTSVQTTDTSQETTTQPSAVQDETEPADVPDEPADTAGTTTSTTRVQTATTIRVWDIDDVYVEENPLSLQCIMDHPGVPGYDTEYLMKAYFEDILLRASEYTISCDSPLVEIDGNKVTIPAESRDQLGDYILIEATYTADPSITDVYPIRNYRWDQTFNDDFNGTKLDSTKWGPMPSYVNGPTSWTVNPECAYVEDGKLILEAVKKPYTFSVDGVTYTSDYSVGGIETYGKFSQKYGCFMASFKMEQKLGTFSAFWLMPVTRSWGSRFLWKNNQTNAFCGEVDIFEHAYLWDGQVMITDHYWNADGSRAAGNSAYYTIEDLYDGFQNFACVWTETGRWIYCNGQLLDSQTDLTATGEEAFMMLDIYMGCVEGQDSSISDWVGHFKDEDLPIRAEVDYVRAYAYQ